MEDQEYVNAFLAVHRKAQAVRDRTNQANKINVELREKKLAEETKHLLDRGVKSKVW
jgi:hypothetical protein